MPDRITTIRLTTEDDEVIAALSKHTGIQSTTELIRYALRMAAQQAGVGGYEAEERRGRARQPSKYKVKATEQAAKRNAALSRKLLRG
jgi:hypothetical protein